MKEKIKFILVGILIGFIVFPTLTLGGTFVVSLIQGKSVEEAIQILAEQIDVLMGKVEMLESKQTKTELWQKKEEACKYAEEINKTIPPPPDNVNTNLIDTAITSCQEWIQTRTFSDIGYARPVNVLGRPLDTVEKIYNWEKSCPEHPDLKVIKPAYEKYLEAKQRCEELTNQYENMTQ